MEQYLTEMNGEMDAARRMQLFRKLDSDSHLEAAIRPNMITLRNCGNTCAIDSVLVALFSYFTDVGSAYEQDGQRKIAEWVANIHKHETISGLLPLLGKFPSEEKFHIAGNPKDAVEFLLYFLKIFSDYICSTKVFKTINNNVVTYARIDRKSSPVQYVPVNAIVGREGVCLQEFIVNRSTTDVSGKVITEEIVQCDLLIFAIGRMVAANRLVTTRILPTPSMTTPNGDRFFLGSIVVSADGHYVTYIRDRMTWYLYDDLCADTINVGQFVEMDTWSPSPITHGVLYFYFPDYSSVDEHVLSKWTSPTRLDIGVFEDMITDKLLRLHSHFGTVVVSSALPILKKLEKSDRADEQMYVWDARSFCETILK